uniref:RNA-binding protein 47 n=1 Tax=Ascaris suum TaxID=6253 RepID=F1L099_ASCSU
MRRAPTCIAIIHIVVSNSSFMDTSAANQHLNIPILRSVHQDTGQRRYGPPLDWNGPPPPRGTEVFVGKLPRAISDMRLIQVLSAVGPLYELRQMLEPSGVNRGYCFAVYQSLEGAKRACIESLQLNNVEIEPGRRIGVVRSVDNRRLFIGGIPREIKADQIIAEIRKHTEGAEELVVYPSILDKSRNRGFAFVEYRDHKSAAYARKKFLQEPLILWGKTVCIDWAEPEQQVDSDIMENVKILYVRNLMLNTDEITLRKYFEMGDIHCIERVKKIRDFAFVHFTTREKALNALNKLNHTKLDGSTIEVCLAKPPEQLPRLSRMLSHDDSKAVSLSSSSSPSICTRPEAIGVPLLPQSYPYTNPLLYNGCGYPAVNAATPFVNSTSPYWLSHLPFFAPLVQQIQNICVPGVPTPSQPPPTPTAAPNIPAAATPHQLSTASTNVTCIGLIPNTLSDTSPLVKRPRERRGSAGFRSAGVQARIRHLVKRSNDSVEHFSKVEAVNNAGSIMPPPSPYSKIPAFLDNTIQVPFSVLNANTFGMTQQAAMLTPTQPFSFDDHINA